VQIKNSGLEIDTKLSSLHSGFFMTDSNNNLSLLDRCKLVIKAEWGLLSARQVSSFRIS